MTRPRKRLRLGLMGFGLIGRQLYRIAAENDDIEVVAVSDIGRPSILHHLLTQGPGRHMKVELDGHYLRHERFDTRLLTADQPHEVPWDVFEVDMVIDATARFRTPEAMAGHLDNGARRVLLSTLPAGHIDRVVVRSVNDEAIRVEDRMISAGSASTAAMAITLKSIDDRLPVRLASMTSVHAYTSDQSLQDYAGEDIRRSRSAAENIIPNTSDAPLWVEHMLPRFAGKLCGYALNVPVQRGSMLDLTLVFEAADVDRDAVNDALRAAAAEHPGVIAATEDPIVSSDVIGCRESVLFDLDGTLRAGRHMVKVLAWHESIGHACRLLEVAQLYADLDQREAT